MQLRYKKILATEIITIFSVALISLTLLGFLLLHNLFISWRENDTINKLNDSIRLKKDSVNILSKDYNKKYKVQFALANFDKSSINPIDMFYPAPKDEMDINTKHQVEGIARFLSSIGEDGEIYSQRYYKSQAKGGVRARKAQLYNLNFINWAWENKMKTGEGDASTLGSYGSIFQKYALEIWNRLIDEVHEKDPNYTFDYLFNNIWPKSTLQYLRNNYNISNSRDFVLFVNSNTITKEDEINYRRSQNLSVEIENEKNLINEAYLKTKRDTHYNEDMLSFYVNSFIVMLAIVYMYKVLRWSLLTIRK